MKYSSPLPRRASLSDRWRGFVATAGEVRFIAALGSLYVVLAVARTLYSLGQGTELGDALATDLLIGLPGVALLYGAYRLSETDLRPEVLPRIVTRCLTGFGAMLALVVLLALTTGLNRPTFTPLVATALGSAAGLAVGVNEARALSRAHEAEQHRDELQQERDLRERIFETSPVGIVLINTDGSIRMANEHAAEITGLPRAELEAMEDYNPPMFEATDAEGNTIEGGLFQQILTTGEAAYDVERQITRTDGTRIWLSINGAPLRGPSGDMSGVIIAFEDVTERKLLERELKETVGRLEASNERLEQFAYAASHDLQEPLRMVSSYLRLIEDRYADELDADGEEFLEYAVDGADRMRHMIDGLLEYSRVDTRGDPFEPVDLDAVLEDVLSDLQVKIEESDSEVTVGELPQIEGDRAQLHQVFQNLVDNAIEYSGEDPPRIHVGAERDGDEWVVSVRDEGIGIDPDETDLVFEVFQSLHSDDEYDGTGIGLALVERIVERHGGDIWVDSEPGVGTTVSVSLPAGGEVADRSRGR